MTTSRVHAFRRIALVACLFALACNEFAKEKPLGPYGSLWSAPVADGTGLFFVSEEKLGRLRFQDFPGQRYAVRYTLHAHDAADGRPLASTLLSEHSDDNAMVAIIGFAHGLLWLWNGALEARDPQTLVVVVDLQEIAEANPDLAARLPTEPRLVGISEALGAPVFQSLDAAYYVLEPNAVARPLSLDERARLAEEAGRFLGKRFLVHGNSHEGISGHGIGDLTTDTHRVGTQQWEILSEKQAEQTRRGGFGSFGSAEGDVPKRVYLTDLDGRGEPDRTTLRPLGSPPQLLPGIALDSRRGVESARANSAALWLEAPPSLLVFHKASLASASPWRVSRLGIDGTPIWETETNLADPQELLSTEHTLVIGGYQDVQESAMERLYRIVFLDLDDGIVRGVVSVSDL